MVVNGLSQTVKVESRDTLLDTLRDKLGLTATKKGCNEATCGACMVSIDGEPYLSCTTLAIECGGRSIQTVESFTTDASDLNILNQFYANSGYQCGYCTPGMVMATKLLLVANPHPTADQIRQWLSGNLCRCGSYNHIVNTVLALGGS
jgi:aerobic-type carbon monoxide dehydrogenase small subunit (CoxS/CutS family)